MTPAPPRRPCSRALIALLLLGLGPAAALAAPPSEELREAAKAYARSDFKRAIALVRPLLYPKIRLSSEEQMVQAHRLLGLSYLFAKDQASAEEQFLSLLRLRPAYEMDPLLDPVATREFFEAVRRRNNEKIKDWQAKERARQAREAEVRRKKAEQLASSRLPAKVLERTVTLRPFWINFVPLGAGQFQNGHRKKGYALLAAQAALGALSVGTYLGLRFGMADETGAVPGDKWDQAQVLKYTQIISGAACLAAVAYGIIDALVYWEPRTVSERLVDAPPRAGKEAGETSKETTYYLSPTLFPAPGGSAGAAARRPGAGLGFGFTF